MSEEVQSSNRAMDGIIFLVSLAACIFMLMFMNEWFWVTLPFLFTYMVKALDWL